MPALRASVARRDEAAIVNTSSIAGIAGLPQRALYSSTKGAIYALTLAMAADHIAEHIRVNCVTPGTADTPWIARLMQAAPDPEAERAALTSPWDGWFRPTRLPRASPTWPARWRARSPAQRSPSTAGCRACVSAHARPDPYRSDDSGRA
jgi:NAD(P)-dependent dehydrogenase (short-subunit alcohol dehydrogenase family)